MKITIEFNDCEQCGLSPTFVYKRLTTEYHNKLCKQHGINFWGLQHSCDSAARELYSHIVSRGSNVKSLILTYEDAERCNEIFKSFADVWASKSKNIKSPSWLIQRVD